MYIAPRVFKAVNQTMACQTKKLGTRLYKCPECDQKKVVNHTCKNRFCPRCGYMESRQWAEKLLSILAPIRHHHVVFTLPEGLLPIVHHYPKVVFNSLFSSASWVLKDWFRYKHNLTPGIVTVLHTAGFALKRHIHLHVLVTGGGIRNGKWHELKRNYLTRIDHFRKRFQWRFEYELLSALKHGKMGTVSETELKRLFKDLNNQRWVVAIQKGLHEPWKIIRYIGRYIKRSPITEQSIQSIDDGIVRFESKNSRGKLRRVVVALPSDEFLRRLLSHVPLEGFHMVRYYGAYQGKKSTKEARQLLWRELQIVLTSIDPPVYRQVDWYAQTVVMRWFIVEWNFLRYDMQRRDNQMNGSRQTYALTERMMSNASHPVGQRNIKCSLQALLFARCLQFSRQTHIITTRKRAKIPYPISQSVCEALRPTIV